MIGTDDQNEQIRHMMERALEQAFQAQIAHLFSVFVLNRGSVVQQQEYTKNGIDNAVAAFRLAMSAVEAWEG